jgi:PhnB protein
MQMQISVNFKGDCEAAFTFYAQHLGAEIGAIFRYGGSPLANQVPEDWSDKVMHGNLTLGGQRLTGADVAPQSYESPKGVSLALQITDAADAERIFQALAAGGTVMMPLEKTFWAERFGMVVDRFGVPWLINCEGAAQPTGV